MAYAAVTCLRTTILHLLNSSRTSVVSSTRRILKFLHNELGFLQEVLERSGSRWNDLDKELICTVEELEDLLEIHEFEQLHSQSQSYGDVQLMRGVRSSVKKVKKIKREYYKKELGKSLPEEEVDDDDNDYPSEEEEEDDDEDGDYGLSNHFNEIKRLLVENCKYVFSIVGMAGIGKTALAERVFHDPVIMERFECRVFVTIGQNYQLEKMKQDILAQVNPNNDELAVEIDERSNDDYLKEYVHEKRYLIVLDDVWSIDFWHDYFKAKHRDHKAKGSCILLTTRFEDIVLTSLTGGTSSYFLMPFLGKVNSWDLLRRKVFAEKVCPPELKNAGKRIAEKCDGLPLMVVTVADILSKAEKTLEFWREAAQNKSLVFEKAYDQILQVLYPCYHNLPPQAKACFLYMAAFPPDQHVRRSKLVNLWCAEGFLEHNDSNVSIQSLASKCFDKLMFDHVVVSANKLSSDGFKYQACSLHSVFRRLCNEELKSNEFLHVVERRSEDGETSKRRISIYHNVLLSFIGVFSPTARSLLCTGAYHKYEVGINFRLMRFLKVCDALTIRFFEFPMEVLKLGLLRYLAITCNQNLPSSLSKLWKLEYLIVHKHLSINSTVAETYLPVEIWDLQELIHVEIMGRNLPDPPSGVKLEKLAKLLDVGSYTCTEGVLKSIPDLAKLRVRIELTPDSADPNLRSLDNISQLGELVSIQLLIVNPILTSEIYTAHSLSVYPFSVAKLTLSGFGYPWENLNTLAKLPHLKVLKLLCYAFQGEIWEVEENVFSKLECLSIEDSELVHWKVRQRNLPCLSHLTLKCCYNLQRFSKLPSFSNITLVDCSSAAVTSALEMKEKCRVTCSSSWDSARNTRNSQDIYTIYSTG